MLIAAGAVAAACCRHASKELVQLSLVSLCLISAWLHAFQLDSAF
jgi:hypothetical protein